LLSPKERRAEFINNNNNFISAFLEQSFFVVLFVMSRWSGRITMPNMSRRRFTFSLPGLIFLVGCGENIFSPSIEEKSTVLKLDQESAILLSSLAQFLVNKNQNPIYDEQTEWDFGQGFLMVEMSGQGVGNYQYRIDGQMVQCPINMVPFDHRRQRLSIIKDGQVIWTYHPPRRTHFIPHEQEVPEP
jgi:hypothetical protein